MAGEFAQQISQPVNFTEDGITFVAEIVSYWYNTVDQHIKRFIYIIVYSFL